MNNCQLQYCTPKVAEFSKKKIERNKHKLVYAFTSEYYTAGHVSNQRSRVGMSSIKGNGSLKKYLRNATLVESLEWICQTLRSQDHTAWDELKRCWTQGFMVGERLWENIQKLISLSMSISYVSPVNINSSKHIVKLHENARKCCEVDLKGRVVWHGDEYFTITGTCPFYKSSLWIFPCACAAA